MSDVQQLTRSGYDHPGSVKPYTFTLRVSERGDGGVDVRSEVMPGLLAGASDVDWLWRSLPPSIAWLLLNNAGVRVVGPIELGPTPELGQGESLERLVTVDRHDPD